jgi:23S rRNA G2445 N2-methylase RlmL
MSLTEDLEEKLRGRGWQPSRVEMARLFERLALADRDEAELLERALARVGRAAADAALQQFSASRPPARGRLVRLIGRFGAEAEPRDFLLRALGDADAKSRRNAVIALGKLSESGDQLESALGARWPDASLEERRSLAEALGKIGGAASQALLAGFETDDAELRRIVGEARLKLQRTLGRAGQNLGRVDAEAAPPRALPVLFRCRHGLAALVAAEVRERLGAEARVVDEETVTATLSAPLGALQSVRTALRFAFPLPAGDKRDPGEAVVAALGSDVALDLMSAFTRGPLRYRIEWASGGHRRGLTFRTAEELARLRPSLLNDPTASLWEAVVDETNGVRVELWPRGLADSRFAYRVEQVPASSHPTLAAALARVAGARPDDVVWDPFVGGGTELIERARLGPFRKLYGCDLDDRALDHARVNLAAAGVSADLTVADARNFRPRERPTLILTNPPMGRRVLNKRLTGALFDEFLTHAVKILAPGGRLVWLSPRAADTAAKARKLGFKLTENHRVDMAGFWAELQSFSL